MTNILSYKGYITKIEYNAEEGILFGKIEGISDLVTIESENLKTIEEEFHSAVDDYLAYCEQVGKCPDKPYKGSFNVRISAELHKKADFEAIKRGVSLNTLVYEAIESFVGIDKTPCIINNYYQTIKNDRINDSYKVSHEDVFFDFDTKNVLS